MTKPPTRTTRLIVATASLGAIITIGIPWVDEYFSLRRDLAEVNELQTEWEDTRARSMRLIQVEKKIDQRLDALTFRSIGPDDTERVREALVQIVRSQGGRLRNLEINPGVVRPWALEGDQPGNETMPQFAEESDYELHSHEVELRADGSLESIERIIRQIAQRGWFAATRDLNITPTGKPESPIVIEFRMTVYGLSPKSEVDDDAFAQA